ncbi:MAG: C39 family peptidase [Balneolales bacterium]|nr:C39 family peptidase [Balneolales bacterium]
MESDKLDDGGTLGVLLANHALRRGYKVQIYTYNLMVFDPTWFELPEGIIRHKLDLQRKAQPHNTKLVAAINAYIDFLDMGGELLFKDLNVSLIRHYLKKGKPILTGLSSTWLYRCARERDDGNKMVYDDINGEACGHFVVLSGFDINKRTVQVADPYNANPAYSKHYYHEPVERLINAILLGIVTYDSNLVIIEKET